MTIKVDVVGDEVTVSDDVARQTRVMTLEQYKKHQRDPLFESKLSAAQKKAVADAVAAEPK